MQEKTWENEAVQAVHLQLRCVGSNDKKFQNAKDSSYTLLRDNLMWYTNSPPSNPEADT